MKTKKINILKAFALASTLFALSANINADIIGFEDVSIPSAGYLSSASDGVIPWVSESKNISVTFSYTQSYGGYAWQGFKASNMTDTSITNLTNQYVSSIGKGANNSTNYAIAYLSSFNTTTYESLTTGYTFAETLVFDSATRLSGMDITNNIYAINSLNSGDSIAKSLDYYVNLGQSAELKVIAKAIDSNYETTANEIEFVLARSYYDESTLSWKGEINDTWQYWDMSSLNLSSENNAVYGIEFTMYSSDKSSNGANWPTYFAFDNLKISAIPEPSEYAALFGLLALSLVFVSRRKK